jgi:hypothetical protein
MLEVATPVPSHVDRLKPEQLFLSEPVTQIMLTCRQEMLRRPPFNWFINTTLMNEEKPNTFFVTHRGILWILLLTILLFLMLAMTAPRFKQPVPRGLDININQGNASIETEVNIP